MAYLHPSIAKMNTDDYQLFCEWLRDQKTSISELKDKPQDEQEDTVRRFNNLVAEVRDSFCEHDYDVRGICKSCGEIKYHSAEWFARFV